MPIEISTERQVVLKLTEPACFRHTAPNGTANIDRVTAVRWNDGDWTISASGFVVKKDGQVGNARRQYILDLDEVPALLRGQLLPLMKENS